ncbi:MAG: bifunctional metallophosphatase/5'-nucleotidase [Sandaracinaceae bacterium]
MVGTNDLHGHLAPLPVLGGYLRVLRELRAADGGAVVLLDGGDLFQGTLASNLGEGAPVIEAYARLGYDAAAIGNHEFDYGPVGPAITPTGPGDDPRGALRARVAEAPFPLLTANLRHQGGGRLDLGPNAPASTLLDRAGLQVGIIGVTTEDTLRTTMHANVADLALDDLAVAIRREATTLRAKGAHVVLVAAHAGGRCEAFDDADDLRSCDRREEIFRLAERLGPGSVDGIVAGHTHRAVAHRVAGIPVIESYAHGRAFGRIDLVVQRGAGRVVESRIHPPRDLCARPPDEAPCAPGTYEGRAVRPDPAVAEATASALAAARALREQPVGVVVDGRIRRDWDEESALGNLFVDLMLAARPDADVALTNGGGLRADLPAGPLLYGAFHRATPFDNRFATFVAPARELAGVVAANLARGGGFLSVGGARVEAGCRGGALSVELARVDGTPIPEDERLTVVTSDYLATAPGPLRELATRAGLRFAASGTIRDAMVDVLRERGGHLRPADSYRRRAPRVRYPGRRPVRCR